MPYKDPDKQREAMRKIMRKRAIEEKRKKKEFRQLFLQHYDWILDAYVIPREEMKRLNLTI